MKYNEKRMLPLTMDESLLVVDSFFSMEGNYSRSILDSSANELSKRLRRLGEYQELAMLDIYRNPTGMEMFLLNLRAYCDMSRKYYKRAISTTQMRIVAYYYENRELLHSICIAIDGLYDKAPSIKDCPNTRILGTRIPDVHIAREHQLRITEGQCPICMRRGVVLEKHILSDIVTINCADYSEGPTICLCSNCHRIVHGHPELYGVEGLLKEFGDGLDVQL